MALRDVIKKQDECIRCLEEENKKLQKSNHELRESSRDSGVSDVLPPNGTAADLNRQMIELTNVIREQVEQQFYRRPLVSDDGSMEDGESDEEGEGDGGGAVEEVDEALPQ